MIEHDDKIDIDIKNKQKKTALEISRHESVKMILRRQSQKNANKKSKNKPSHLLSSSKTSDCTGTSPSKPFAIPINSPSVAPSIASQSQEKKTEVVKPTLTMKQRLEALLSSLERTVPGIVRIDSVVKLTTHKKREVVNFMPVDVASSDLQSVPDETDASAVLVCQGSLTSVLPIVTSEMEGQENQMVTMEPEPSVPKSRAVEQEDKILSRSSRRKPLGTCASQESSKNKYLRCTNSHFFCKHSCVI